MGMDLKFYRTWAMNMINMIKVNVRSHNSYRRERNIVFKGVETSHYKTRFKNFEGKPERKSSKRIVSASSGLRLLQWYKSQTRGGVLARTLGPQRKWIVRSHIG